MTECKQIQDLLPAFLEGALSSGEHRLVHEHLATCQRCSAALEDLKKVALLVQGIDEVEPPPWFTQKVMSKVREEAGRKKGGVLDRLFYPLHVKVPIQALASLLIAVLALYVYRSVEPEMKVVQVPSEVASRGSIPENQPQQQHDKVGPSVSIAENKPSLGQRRERPAGTIAEVPRTKAPKIYEREEAPPLASPASEPAKAEKKEATAEKHVQETRAAAPSPTQQTAAQAQNVSPPLLTRRDAESSVSAEAQAKMKEAHDRSVAQPAGQMQAFGTKKAEAAVLTLRVNDVTAAIGEIKGLLGQLGARSIATHSRNGAAEVAAELGAEKMEQLRRKLTALGQLEEKESRPVATEGFISIRIEITSKPYTN